MSTRSPSQANDERGAVAARLPFAPEVGKIADGLTRSMKRFHELHRSNAQTVRELHDINKANVSLPAFDTAHIIAMKISQFSQLLL